MDNVRKINITNRDETKQIIVDVKLDIIIKLKIIRLYILYGMVMLYNNIHLIILCI